MQDAGPLVKGRLEGGANLVGQLSGQRTLILGQGADGAQCRGQATLAPQKGQTPGVEIDGFRECIELFDGLLSQMYQFVKHWRCSSNEWRC